MQGLLYTSKCYSLQIAGDQIIEFHFSSWEWVGTKGMRWEGKVWRLCAETGTEFQETWVWSWEPSVWASGPWGGGWWGLGGPRGVPWRGVQWGWAQEWPGRLHFFS